MLSVSEISINEEFNDETFSMTGRLTPIGGASSDAEHSRRSFSFRFRNFIF